MAKATIEIVERPVLITTTVVRLELTTDESDTLHHILSLICGDTKHTHRKHADSIRAAMSGGGVVGIPSPNNPLGQDNRQSTGFITFIN